MDILAPLAPSKAYANKMLNRGAGGSAWTPPTNLLWAAWTVMPDDDGAGGTECAGGGYARLNRPNSKAWWTVAVERLIENAVELAWPEPASSWGTVVGIAAFDAADGTTLVCRSIAYPWFVDGRYLVVQRDAALPRALGFVPLVVEPGAPLVLPAGTIRLDLGPIWTTAMPVPPTWSA